MKKSLLVICVAMIMMIGHAAGTCAAESVRIGAAINLTGPASTWGQFHAKGQQDYFTYVNETKGGIEGQKIDMILVDTMYKVQEAVAAVRKFAVRDRVHMIATWGAGEGLAAKPLVQRYKIPTINYSTSWEILEEPIEYMYLPFGSYRLDCYAILDYIKTMHTKSGTPKVGLLTYNNAYGRSIHKPSQEFAEKAGIEIVSIEEFPPKTVDLTTELLRLQKSGAEYVFMQMLPAAIVTAFKSAERIGYDPMFFGTWTSTDPDFFKMGEGLIKDRLRIQFPGGLPGDNSEGMKLMKELWKKYKTVDSFDASYWEGVAVGMIMERALRNAKQQSGKITRETINKAMENFKNESFGGLLPDVSYSSSNHEGSFKARIVQVKEDGTFVPLTNFFVPGKDPVKIIGR
ncbi:MAG: ABC transporter substrate-binding protein [Syntrophales bacterium]|nr:ABC transporter substrate-binding protein [Syntrophales bacterium]MDY0045569.1 ABC transporter substrate-binding protein [Syntrophales bacterium]